MPQANLQTLSNAAPGSNPLADAVAATRGLIDNSATFHLEAPLAPSTDSFTGLHEKARREAETGFTDYAGAMFRQDSPIDGIAAWAVENRYQPDPQYNPFDPKGFEELSAGVDPQFHPELLKATSREQAMFTRERLLRKQADLAALSDLGVPGNIGRLAMGFVDPANLALGLASGGVTMLARGGATAARARSLYTRAAATGDAAMAARGAEMAAKVAGKDASLGGIAAGVANAAIGGYAFEKVRQSVNYEDSELDAVVAGLVGTAFSAPFIYMGSRAGRRAQMAAAADLEKFRILKDVQETGRDLTPEERAHFAYHEPADAPTPKRDDVDAAWKAKNEADAARIKAEVEVAYAQRELQRITPDAPEVAPSRAAKRAAQERQELIAEVDRKVRRALDDAPADSAMREAFAAAVAKAAKAEVAHPDAITAEIADLIHRPLPEAAPDVQAPRASTEGGQAPALDAPALDAPATPSRVPVGEVTTFTHKGDMVDGTITGIREDGRLEIEDLDGKLRVVHPDDIEPGAPGSTSWEPPSGFLPGSVGSAQVAHIVTDVPRAAMNKTATVAGAGISARFDIGARINRSANKTVRSLGQMLVKEAIATSDFYAQSMAASEYKRHIQRTLGGSFHLEAGNAFQAASQKMGWRWWEQGAKANVFYADVTRLMIGDLSILDAPRNATIKGELQKAAGAMQKTYKAALEEAKRVGVQGAENVEENIHYANRVWRVDRILEMQRRHGEGKVVELLHGARRAAGHNGEPANTRTFLRTIKKLEHSPVSTDILLQARDMGTLRRELDRAGLQADEINEIVDTLFEVKKTEGDSGNAPNLKYRFQIDETYSMGDLAVRDLMENDARILVDRYLNSMGGHIALAKKGVKSRADWEALLKKADEEHAADDANPDRAGYADERRLLEDMHSYVTGRPMSVQTFSTVDRVAAAARGYARSVYLGQLGFTAALELTHAAGHATWSAALMQMPALKQFWKAMRAGYVPEGTLADDLRTMTGFSTEHASSYARQSEISEFTYDRTLTKWENAANKASHAVDKLSGNNFLTSYTRGLASAFTAQKYVNLANGKLKLTAAERRRMVGAGIDDDAIENVLAGLKAHADVDARGRVERIRYEEWSAKDPDSYHAFITALERDVRSSIQDHDIGETWFTQHTALGKFFTELRAFAIAAHAKQTLSTLHYRDARSLNLWLTSFVTQAVGYMVQTSVNFSHSKEELDKRLSADRVVKAAIARMNVAGIMPVLLNTFVAKPLGQDLSGSGLTANTENRDLFSTPTTMLVGRALSTLQASGQSIFAGENFTGKDVKNAIGLLPGSNLWAARNLVDWTASLAPKSELPQ